MNRQSTGSVYDKTYARYLEQLKSRPFEGREAVLGIQKKEGRVVIPYFDSHICWAEDGLSDRHGRQPGFADCVVLCRYLMMAPAVEPHQTDWVAYRDFPDAGPLTVFWADAVEGPLKKTFSRRVDALARACSVFRARDPAMAISADLCRVFSPLPKVPLLLVFNDADEDFPAATSLLFEKRAAFYLDAESMAILGQRLVERILGAA